MSTKEAQQAISKLTIELSNIIQQYEECVKRDDFFEIKRKLIVRIREIEQDIDRLDPPQNIFPLSL